MVSEVQWEVLLPLGLVRAVSLGYPQGTGRPGAFGALSKCGGPASSLVSIAIPWSGCSPALHLEQLVLVLQRYQG